MEMEHNKERMFKEWIDDKSKKQQSDGVKAAKDWDAILQTLGKQARNAQTHTEDEEEPIKIDLSPEEMAYQIMMELLRAMNSLEHKVEELSSKIEELTCACND